MRLLIHVAGQSDLLLDRVDSGNEEEDERETSKRIRERHERVEAALHDKDSLRRLLADGAFDDGYASTEPPIPLLRALATLGVAQTRHETPDLDVVVLGTDEGERMDTLPIAHTLAEALREGVAGLDQVNPVKNATAVAVNGFSESDVVATLGRHLAAATEYREAFVTWGSGSTALTLDALTALSHANLRWRLVTTTPGRSGTIDLLAQLDVDPVVGVLLRWRMFGTLDRLASDDPPRVKLTDAQRRLIWVAAHRRAAGMQSQDAGALRAVVADAVVRRDGTAGLAVRRYIPARYRELRATDPPTDQPTRDLLEYAEENCPRGPLGRQFRWLDKCKRNGDPVVLAAAGLPSTVWLFNHRKKGSVIDALQEIGRNSHTLRFPGPRYARILGKHLSSFAVDGNGWADAELPQPPLSPPDTVLMVWLAGAYAKRGSDPVGVQIASGAVPDVVCKYIDVEPVRTRSVIFGVPGSPGKPGSGSLHLAERDAQVLSDAGFDAWVDSIDLRKPDLAAVKAAIEDRITSETAALLLIPTGAKKLILTLLHAMRRIGAEHGIPLFVRQNATPREGDRYTETHLWPALTGGDLPLLLAAQEALRSLELDVAWRLLAASAIDPAVTDQTQRLAAAFACRDPMNDDQWPAPDDPVSPPDLPGRTRGMAAQRIALVKEALAHPHTEADRIRLLVLAAGALEASIAGSNPQRKRRGAEYGDFRKKLCQHVHQHRGTRGAEDALVLLLLNEARNQAPITHGDAPDSVTAIANAIEFLHNPPDTKDARCIKDLSLSDADLSTLPRDLDALLNRAVAVDPALDLGQPYVPMSLIDLHRKVETQITEAIGDRACDA